MAPVPGASSTLKHYRITDSFTYDDKESDPGPLTSKSPSRVAHATFHGAEEYLELAFVYSRGPSARGNKRTILLSIGTRMRIDWNLRGLAQETHMRKNGTHGGVSHALASVAVALFLVATLPVSPAR